MYKNLKLKDVFITIILLTITIIVSYFYVNNQARNQLWQSIYPIRARLAWQHISCSPDSPVWLKELLKEKTLYQNALANEIAYIDASGQLFHCESGYIHGYPIGSKPINKNTRFRYASVTKLWTADAIFDLIKDNKLTLDSHLAELLPEITNPQDARVNDITIRQLLEHQGGFNRLDIRGYDMFGIGEPICPNDIDKLNTIKLNFTPGSQTSYSNLGYCLLGKVIEQVSGQSYQEYIEDNYHISQDGITFISNYAMSDEVQYNYTEDGLTGIDDIYTAFDYDELYSVAGLSGSAVALAQQVKQMSMKPAPNILSKSAGLSCDITEFRDCYGYAMNMYQASSTEPVAYYRDGALLGLSSLAVVGSQGEVVVLLSNGTAYGKYHNSNLVKKRIYDALLNSQK